jgi:hypothetical protein
MKRSLLWVVVALAWPGFVRAQVAREVDLRPKFIVGQSTRYRMEMTNSSEPVAHVAQRPAKPPATAPKPVDHSQSPSDKSSSKIEYTFSLKPQSVGPDREATVNLVFEAVKMSTTNKDGTVEFDSTKPGKDDDLVAGLLKPLVGSTLTLKIDQGGNITGITGGEAFSGLGQFVGGGGGAGNLFGQIFSSRKQTGLARVGESWETAEKVDTTMLGQFDMSTRYTLGSATFNEAKVTFTGKIAPGTEAPGDGAGKVKDSSYSGSYSWDTERGALKRMDSTMRVRMETSSEGVRSETNNESVVKLTQVR